MLIVLVMAMAVGLLISAFLQQSFGAVRTSRFRLESIRALYDAEAELAVARAIIGLSGYSNGQNDAIQAALAAPNGYVAGTTVSVTQPDPLTNLFELEIRSGYDTHYERVLGQSLQEAGSAATFNLMVLEDDIGISGAPRGNIFAGGTLEFFLPGGYYQDAVAAVNGFVFRSDTGATEENTTLAGPYDPAADPSVLTAASLPQVSDLLAEAQASGIVMTGNVSMRLRVDSDGNQVMDYCNYSTPSSTETVAATCYEVCSENDSGAFAVWDYTTETVTITDDTGGVLLDGSGQPLMQEEEVWYIDHYEREVACDPPSTVTYYNYDWVYDVPVAEDAIIFVDGDVYDIEGEVLKPVTIASTEDVQVTGNIRYVDAAGNFAMLNGTDPSQPYERNPSYTGNASLGLIAAEDVKICSGVPDKAEINANFAALGGQVRCCAIYTDSSGDVTGYNNDINSHIRRLGSVLSKWRPLETLVESGVVKAGFLSGVSIFDEAAALNPPPGYISVPKPQFLAGTLKQ